MIVRKSFSQYLKQEVGVVTSIYSTLTNWGYWKILEMIGIWSNGTSVKNKCCDICNIHNNGKIIILKK